MAGKSKTAPEKSFEEWLWDSANKLRGSVESSEYKHIVLSLIFLKFISDRFAERRRAIAAEHAWILHMVSRIRKELDKTIRENLALPGCEEKQTTGEVNT